MQFRCWILTALLISPVAHASQEVVGRASVIDGDTISVNQKRIRFWGIDAPESAQSCQDARGRPWPCGRRAANALDEHLGQKTVRCVSKDKDRYQRMVAECFVSGQSINAWMVRSGHALAYRQYSTAFVANEALAKRDRVGVWQGHFQMPWDFRKAKRAGGKPTRAEVEAPGGCTIKGNISSKGRKIYHSPGQRDYAKTRIDLRKGERMFCSSRGAERAGFRAAER